MKNQQKTKRTDRIEEMLQRKLAEIIPLEVRDPRMPHFVTITGAKVSSDLSYAKIYFTVLMDNKKEAVEILNHAAGYLRSVLAQTSKLRTMPKLQFVYDESIDYGRHMNRLIDIANRDEDVE